MVKVKVIHTVRLELLISQNVRPAMHKIFLALSITCILLTGCSASSDTTQSKTLSAPGTSGAVLLSTAATAAEETGTDTLPDSLLESYYLSSDDPAYKYLQNKSVGRFFDMWFESSIEENARPDWNYDTLAPVELLDHDFKSIAKPDDKLYTCTFTTEDGRCGYIIVSYYKDGPSFKKWSLYETTPHQIDLKANSGQIAAALAETDIDLSTATATRAEWIDTKKNRGDRIIFFTDGKGDRYVCYLGDDDYTIEKQQ